MAARRLVDEGKLAAVRLSQHPRPRATSLVSARDGAGAGQQERGMDAFAAADATVCVTNTLLANDAVTQQPSEPATEQASLNAAQKTH